MSQIAEVHVYLDDNFLRCQSITSLDENGNVISDHQELIGNKEFNSQEELIKYVANRLGVSEERVTILE